MPDIDLDQLLHQTRPPAPAPGAVAVARELAARAGRAADPRRSGRRRRATPRLVAAAVTGAVLLSGATTLAAHQLRIPPFQTVPAGIQRLEEPVPIDVVEPDGTPGRCLVYLELAAVDAADLDRLDQEIAERSWSPAEQQEVTGPATPRTEEQLSGDQVTDSLFRLALAVIPDLRFRGDEGPRFVGYAATCRPDAR